jgi:hypothetical protein
MRKLHPPISTHQERIYVSGGKMLRVLLRCCSRHLGSAERSQTQMNHPASHYMHFFMHGSEFYFRKRTKAASQQPVFQPFLCPNTKECTNETHAGVTLMAATLWRAMLRAAREWGFVCVLHLLLPTAMATCCPGNQGCQSQVCVGQCVGYQKARYVWANVLTIKRSR